MTFQSEPLDMPHEYVELRAAQAPPEPVTSTGDGAATVTIQGDEGVSPALAVLTFVAPLLVVALALVGVARLLRWIERRRG